MTEIEFTEMAERAVSTFAPLEPGYDEQVDLFMDVWDGGRHSSMTDPELETLAAVLARSYPGTHCTVHLGLRTAEAKVG